MAWFARGGATLKNLIKRRQNEERKKCRADETTDNNRGEWLLNFTPRACSEEHGNQAERGDAGGNEHRGAAAARRPLPPRARH